MSGLQQHIHFANLATLGLFRSGSDPIYFKAWDRAEDSMAEVSASSQFYGSEGLRGGPHNRFSVGYVMDLLRKGLMSHPKKEELLAAFSHV